MQGDKRESSYEEVESEVGKERQRYQETDGTEERWTANIENYVTSETSKYSGSRHSRFV